MIKKLSRVIVTKLLLVIGVALTSVAHAQNTPLYLDRVGLSSRSDDFMNLGLSLGRLENTKFLKEKERQSLKEIQGRVAGIRRKYKSQAMDEVWKIYFDEKYRESAIEAKEMDISFQVTLNRLNRDRGGSSVKPFDPYYCTLSSKDRETREVTYSSEYVQDINIHFKLARRTLNSLEHYLPRPRSSGAMMLTQADYYRIEGESVFCIPIDGSVNPDVAAEAGARKIANNPKKRVPPYSESRNPQDEMMCRNLDDPTIPPPFGVKCLFNYK